MIPLRVPPTVSTDSKFYRSLTRGGVAEATLSGRVLVVDPSCGSESSQPGYAIRQAGELIDSGVIDMPIHEDLAKRIYYLGRVLREQFPEKFDVVVVEDVPSHRFSKFRGRTHASFASQLSLHAAVHAVMASVPCSHFLKIAPATWHRYVDESYQKSDESDAIVMSHAVVHMARHAAEAGTRGRRKKKGRRSK